MRKDKNGGREEWILFLSTGRKRGLVERSAQKERGSNVREGGRDEGRVRARDSTVTKGPDLARLPKEIYILYRGGGGGCSNARGCTENTKESNMRRVREGEARGDPLVSTRSRGGLAGCVPTAHTWCCQCSTSLTPSGTYFSFYQPDRTDEFLMASASFFTLYGPTTRRALL